MRLDDVTQDPRYGKNAPFYGMPAGHLPVRSYLAVPVKGVAGEVIGGLFFGHSQVGVFTEQHERLAVGVAAWASVALENARLYAEAQTANRMKDEFSRSSRTSCARRSTRSSATRGCCAAAFCPARRRRAGSKHSNGTPRG